ncbi:hypothetical protein [Bradyrhizobium sp. SZCCHNRI1058]|uniref:hypothetical protein n=1 Tax=Bradyrhizobium TaxID=374 RepID=UPI002916FE4F|nr:hypothetical protein [Bradyrhizobium sp. SZCCHNRI1058]
MRCLPRDEADALAKKLDREIAECARPKAVLYEDSASARDYAVAARAIAGCAGRFSEAAVLFRWALRGDGWDDLTSSDETWSRYRNWRASNGEHRRLYEAPAHLFGGDEMALFAKAIEFALSLGWDAMVAAKPKRQLILLSHDYRIEIYHGFGGGALTRQLIGLGWRMADARRNGEGSRYAR